MDTTFSTASIESCRFTGVLSGVLRGDSMTAMKIFNKIIGC
jgi:hypothetical protein